MEESDEEQISVSFSGDFESANIDQVRTSQKDVYDVFIRNDSNSSLMLNWFYFKMRN